MLPISCSDSYRPKYHWMAAEPHTAWPGGEGEGARQLVLGGRVQQQCKDATHLDTAHTRGDGTLRQYLEWVDVASLGDVAAATQLLGRIADRHYTHHVAIPLAEHHDSALRFGVFNGQLLGGDRRVD